MLTSLLAGLAGGAFIEFVCLRRISSPPRRSLFQSSIFVVSIAVGLTVGIEFANRFVVKWQEAMVVGLSVAVAVALGQAIVYVQQKTNRARS